MAKPRRQLPKPPVGLSAEARRWWHTVLDGWDLDESGLLVLETALRALDKVREAEAHIKEHGLLIKDRWGQWKPNPAAVILRDSRSGMLQAWKALNLDVEPPFGKPGRPPGKGR